MSKRVKLDFIKSWILQFASQSSSLFFITPSMTVETCLGKDVFVSFRHVIEEKTLLGIIIMETMTLEQLSNLWTPKPKNNSEEDTKKQNQSAR